MEIFLLLVVLGMTFSISSKLDDFGSKEETEERKKKVGMSSKALSKMVGRLVVLHIDQDEIQDSYLFDAVGKTKGIIKEIDEGWLVFEYETKKEVVTRYFRVEDVVGLDEVK